MADKRPRTIANDFIDAVETATRPWTRQSKSEERYPGNVRYRASRMTREPRISLKEAAWEVMGEAYMRASENDTLPAQARQIYYQARPKIMAMTENRALESNYFSQTLLPDYIEETGVNWDVVYDARGHFEEPHTNRRMGCGTIDVRDYLAAAGDPAIEPPDFAGAKINTIGPSGNIAGILFIEKEGFAPLFKAVNLANRYDLMIVSTKGVSVTAARKLIDESCGNHGLPLFVLHDFDVAGFVILGTLQRDTRRYQFANSVEVIDLGLRLEDIEGLEREPAAATKIKDPETLRAQLRDNGATEAEIDILLNWRVELNAMTSGALITMIESKLEAYGLEKIVPNNAVLAETYRAFHRSQRLREKFEDMEQQLDKEAEAAADIPEDLEEKVRAILAEHTDLRWDDAILVVLDHTQLSHVRAEKEKAKRKTGDFTSDSDGDEPTEVRTIEGDGR